MGNKRALITGITGQDGAYLSRFLLDKGYEVYGTYRRLSTPNFWRLQALDVFEKVKLIPADLLDASSMVEAIKIASPDEVYNLAAQSFVGASFEQPIGTGNITGIGVARILEAIRQINPEIRFYQASTSELYGNSSGRAVNEKSPFAPASPYSVAKLYGYWITHVYRRGYEIFACNGILFNHESPLRGMEFVTRKISNAAAKIALGLEKEVRLGNLDSKRDWGYAPDYVDAMWRMLQQDEPADFVIATNETHSVREFAQRAFEVLDMDWREYVKVDRRFFRPVDVNFLQGDYSKAKAELGWEPTIRFDGLVQVMVKEDFRRWEQWLEGERFPWDAPNYPNEANIITRTVRA